MRTPEQRRAHLVLACIHVRDAIEDLVRPGYSGCLTEVLASMSGAQDIEVWVRANERLLSHLAINLQGAFLKVDIALQAIDHEHREEIAR